MEKLNRSLNLIIVANIVLAVSLSFFKTNENSNPDNCHPLRG
jgi:hypothetical protein